MKITPDSSLFRALSNFPSPTDVRRRAPAEPVRDQVQARAEDAAKSGDNRAALVRQALEQGAARQAALRQTTAAAEASATRAATSANVARPETGSVRREVPFGDSQPNFVRLGQFIDIRV